MKILLKRNSGTGSNMPATVSAGEPVWFKDMLYVGSVGTSAGGVEATIGTPVRVAMYRDLASYQPVGSYKTVQTAVSDPSASGTSTSFISTMSQDANGVITATKASLPTASSTVAGIVTLGASGGAATYSHNHSGTYKPVQSAVSDPTASGTSTSFISTMSQDANGVITATKASLPTASTTVAGIMKLGASGGAATYSHNHSGVYKPVQTAVSNAEVVALSGTTLTFKQINQNTNGVISTENSSTSLTFGSEPSSTNYVVTKAELDNTLAANDAMVFKGTIGSTGATVESLPTSGYSAGWTYKVITAGTYAGQTCEIGDMIICVKDYASGSASDSDWSVIQTNIDGAVTGPASSTSGHIATFNGTSGKVIQDSGYTIATSVPSGAVFTDKKVTPVALSNTGTTNYNILLANNSSTPTANGQPNYASDAKINGKGEITAAKFVKSGGTSAQFLKADGSVDSNTYLTSETQLSLGTPTGSGNAVTSISVSGHTITVAKDSTFLTSHQTVKVDGVTGATTSHYGTCGTAAGTAAKAVSVTGTPALEAGLRVIVKFTVTNTATNPTLNVNSTGAKAIYYRGSAITGSSNNIIQANRVYEFVYDGTYWQLVGDIDTNTTYSFGALGSTTKPIYLSGTNTFAECSTYAGGTKVTLNGSDKGGSTASFYAPTTAGTSGYYLKSSGSGAPTWASFPSIPNPANTGKLQLKVGTSGTAVDSGFTADSSSDVALVFSNTATGATFAVDSSTKVISITEIDGGTF